MNHKLSPAAYKSLVAMAIREDVGRGDITAKTTVGSKVHGRAVILSKGHGVLAGMPVALEVFRQVDRRIKPVKPWKDGRKLEPGDRIMEVHGPAGSILAAERASLNFLQRLSGIATATNILAARIKGTRAKVFDTRKTIPGYRGLDKYAVRVGGGVNHRDGLYDQILLKENHFVAAAADGLSFAAVIRQAKKRAGRWYLIEVETETLEQFRLALAEQADIIMLDEFSLANMRKAVAEAKSRRPRPILEASGGITEKNILSVARTGVDRISIGALTHSVQAFDMAMYMESAQ